jgi:serine/threonine protein kinase
MATIDGVPRQVLRFEYIPGEGLDALLSLGPLPATQVKEMTRGLLHATAVLHEAQLVHRDIKPANIMLRHGNPGDPVLLDLGLARPLDVTSLTAYPQFVGTLVYAAPEQIRGERARNAADLWSIGVVAAQALIGKHPYWTSALTADPSNIMAILENFQVQLPNDTPTALKATICKLVSPQKSRRGSARTAERMLD